MSALSSLLAATRAAPFPSLALALALVAAPSRAAGATTTVSVDAVGRLGPAGAMLFAGVARRWAREDGASRLAQGRYLQLGASLGVNPAYAQGSLAAEWAPLAPLQLELEYAAFGFFGANGSLLRFPSKDARFGSDEIDALSGREESGLGHRVLLGPVLRAKAGRVILRNQTDLAWYSLSRRSGWYHEWEHDTLLDESDWLVADRATVFVELWSGPRDATLLLGPMYELTHAGAAGLTRHRVGACLYSSLVAKWIGFDRVRLYALAGVNVSDRNRQGEPFGMLALGGDLVAAPAP